MAMKNSCRQSLLFLVLLSQIGWAQNDKPTSMATLDQIARQMQLGIYERIINLGYIPSPDKYERRFTPQAHTEFTLLFLRFYGFERTSDQRAYIGKVFMSERYLEKHYNKKYINHTVYAADKDGFFMACKLYFDERTLEYRLNIYPEYVLNICRKNMHYNSRRCTSTAQHWKSLNYVTQLPDRHFDHFSQNDNPDSTRAFLSAADPAVNIRHLIKNPLPNATDPLLYTPSFATRNSLRTINLEKHIKVFKVGYIDDTPSGLGQTLTLKLTKYPLSEDLIEGLEYTYNFIATSSIDDSKLAKRGQSGFFVSRNPLYRSLITSNEPNDRFVPGLNLANNLQLAYLQGSTYQGANKQATPAIDLANKLATQDSTLKMVQQKTDLPATTGAVPDSEAPILISSPANRTTFWVYGGQDVSPEKMPKPGSVLQPQESYYLRDTIPLLADNLKRIWLKGKISFNGDQCLIQPDDQKISWRIMDQRIVLDQSNTTRHIWLQIAAINDTEAKKNTGIKAFFSKKTVIK